MAFFNSNVFQYFSSVINPTFHLKPGDVKTVPLLRCALNSEGAAEIGRGSIALSKSDYDSFEISRDFKRHPLV